MSHPLSDYGAYCKKRLKRPFDALWRLTHLMELDLSGISIGVEGAKVIANALEKRLH